MTFLEVVRKANTFSRLQGEIDTVLSTKGLQEDLVDFVKAAYVDIQLTSQDWAWRYASGVLSWTPTSTSYSNDEVERYTKIYYNNTTLTYVEYDSWLLNTPTTAEKPSSFTIIPENTSIIINPADTDYVVNYRYYKAVDELTTNSQALIIPKGYELIVAYKAAADLAYSLGNYDVSNTNLNKYDIILGQLKRLSILPKRIKTRPIV